MGQGAGYSGDGSYYKVVRPMNKMSMHNIMRANMTDVFSYEQQLQIIHVQYRSLNQLT